MTVYTWDGRVLHHKDCTYCIHRRSISLGKPKGRAKPAEKEVCSLHDNAEIAPPLSDGRRCPDYQQRGCNCPRCIS